MKVQTPLITALIVFLHGCSLYLDLEPTETADMASPDAGLDVSIDLIMESDLPKDMTPDLTVDMAIDMTPVGDMSPEDMAPDLSEDMAPDLNTDMAPDSDEDMTPDPNEDMPPDKPIPSGVACLLQSARLSACNPVDQTGCLNGQECKIVFVGGTLDTYCSPTMSGLRQEGQQCNPASPSPDCRPELACIVNVCRQICRIYDAYGCDPAGPNPACRNEYSQSGYGTCWPTCQP